ncbi:hypothetical protein PR048_032274 [Dryococelus australis]|uniref:Zinc finger PHD-type domain-containing protein n=1 Tax=Dryococelus australis TaxID=614101 RepID=A0ABQ9G5W6_9NEOP|nr:hypothetical protein PR048_032274 [Dryococelus australis]
MGLNENHKTRKEEPEDIDEKALCDDSDNDDICVSGYSYVTNLEVMVKYGICVYCALWVHSECAGWDSAENYTCDVCMRKF